MILFVLIGFAIVVAYREGRHTARKFTIVGVVFVLWGAFQAASDYRKFREQRGQGMWPDSSSGNDIALLLAVTTFVLICSLPYFAHILG